MGIESILARLAGTCSWKTEQLGYSYGSLSVSDIAYCLSGLSPEHTAFCRVKYLHDPEPMPDLVKWVLENTPENKHSLPMAMLAILESVSPRDCVSCSGRGEIHHKAGKVSECDRCRGSGDLPFTTAERARLMGINFSTYRKNWADRYDNVYRRLSYVDSELIRHIRARMQ